MLGDSLENSFDIFLDMIFESDHLGRSKRPLILYDENFIMKSSKRIFAIYLLTYEKLPDNVEEIPARLELAKLPSEISSERRKGLKRLTPVFASAKAVKAFKTSQTSLHDVKSKTVKASSGNGQQIIMNQQGHQMIPVQINPQQIQPSQYQYSEENGNQVLVTSSDNQQMYIEVSQVVCVPLLNKIKAAQRYSEQATCR